MSTLKVVTINILNDLYLWEKRRWLLVESLRALNPDIIAIQEANLSANITLWISEQIGFPYYYISPKTGFEKTVEGLAILSRLPFESMETLDLKGQNRVAQIVQVRMNERILVTANVHLYWQPGESTTRKRQIDLLLEKLQSISKERPRLVCGDFNATPETAAIQRMRLHFVSAYAAIHGEEPLYTCPTPLRRSWWVRLRTTLGFFVLFRPRHLKHQWHGTLDYIFVDPSLPILDCQVVLNQPSKDDSTLYPSDHFGLCATLEI